MTTLAPTRHVNEITRRVCRGCGAHTSGGPRR